MRRLGRMIEVEKLLEALKLPVRVFVGLALATGVLLYAPEGFVHTLGLEELRAEHRMWTGLVFLGSCAVAGVALGLPVWNVVRTQVRNRWLAFRGRKYLHKLSPGEKEVLRGYIHQDTKTQVFWPGDGNVQELKAQGIVRRAGNVGFTSGFSYNIQPWAWDYLQRHPELLD